MPRKKTAAQKKIAAAPFSFRDIRVVQASCKQAIRLGPPPSKNSVRVRIDIMEPEPDAPIKMRPKVEFTAWYEDTSPDDPAVFVEVQFQLAYEMTAQGAKLPESQRFELLGQLTMLHSWPYFREYLQSQINKMGLPPVILPLLAVPPSGLLKRFKNPK